MNYILFDGTVRNALLPLTFTRPVAEIRVGILTNPRKVGKTFGNYHHYYYRRVSF